MKFSEIIGQKEMAARLRSLADDNRLPHAIMLCGPQGSGKMALALALASYLLCTGKNEDGGMFATEETKHDDSCGHCPSCAMIAKWQHPDLHFTFPVIRPKSASAEKPFSSEDYMADWNEMLMSKGVYFTLQNWLASIKVENQQSIIPVGESDRITRILSMKSNQGGKKICIIWLPEKMNLECANKLLKLIEEPPAETHIIMASERPDLLLETIRSRVQRFEVKGIAQDDVIDALMERRGLGEEDAVRIARLSGGSWTKATELLEPGNEEEFFYDLYVMLMRLAFQRKVADLKKWSDQVAGLGREKQIRMLKAFQRLTREYFMYNFHKKELNYLTVEEEKFAVKFSPFINEGNIIGMYELFQRVIRDIGQNASAKIQFFDLTMKMAMLIHKT